jgi:hypothetical protein
MNKPAHDSYFVIRMPQTRVLFVIRKVLYIISGAVSILRTLRNTNYEYPQKQEREIILPCLDR